jgi:two-component system, cell cycle response regulator DivK
MLPEDAHVLVVEDNIDNRFIVLEMLRRMGVKSCTGMAAGWQLFKHVREHTALRADLILLDIQLPGDDGYAVFQRIRETPALRDTKVIAVTANVSQQDVVRVRQAGFNGFIGKPLNRDRFPDQVRRILSGQEVWDSPRD